ncbi:thioredoxin [Nocardia mangyaensis]|uniref:Thioredoxin n=1 Tax=Nocardia mangyaensis TaxID=2213200 RepID=A0A1J0W261_9NOCA|nr:thioredoxin domain-containing protein [Nocardia mangyaensis]APE38411.1 thioredoxin [Nocardia mangyaensis]
MSRRVRILTTVATVLVIAVGAVVLAAARTDERAPARDADSTAEPAVAVRPNSHRLSDPAGARVTLVEFLDFECEACGAIYPAMERLRAEYGDRVSFVVRYFPIPAHRNSGRAALAAEAAAEQGGFERMYQRLFETQAEWGEKQFPQDAVFRGLATEIGLDMAAFDRAYNHPRTATRVQADFDEGLSLGVQGTPTFFINGKKITVTGSRELAAALDSALE